MNTKEHILRETFSLMNRLGVQAMTMDMVAAACGMSKRTLYEQFGSKRLEMSAGLAHVLKKAQAEGLVLGGISPETAAFVFISSMQALHDVVHGINVEVPKLDVFDTAFVTLMRGMATIKGVEYIDAFLATHSLNNE